MRLGQNLLVLQISHYTTVLCFSVNSSHVQQDFFFLNVLFAWGSSDMVIKQMFALFEVWNSNEDKAKTKFTDYRKPNLHLKRYL